jgi:hypothetical protein
VYFDNELIYRSPYITVAFGEVGSFERYGCRFVFKVNGFGHLGNFQLLIDGRDADEFQEILVLDKERSMTNDSTRIIHTGGGNPPFNAGTPETAGAEAVEFIETLYAPLIESYRQAAREVRT